MTNKVPDSLQKPASKSIAVFAFPYWKTSLWMLVILILSFLPGKAFEKITLFDFSYQDLIVHFFMYAVFTFLLIKDLSSKKNTGSLKKAGWIIPLLICAVLGVVTEIVQYLWITGRSGSLSDFILNMCGSGVVILICRIPRVRKKLTV
jgi:hypothetical protein